MRILLINDPGIPVPPKLYGGIERIVYQLAEEYTSQGHEVTLLAGPDSYCGGKTVRFGFNILKKSKWQVIQEILFVWKYLFLNHKKFDVVHSFGRLIYLFPILNKPLKKVMSYQREVTIENIKSINKLPHKSLHFTGCSDYISKKAGLLGNWSTVYNFVDMAKYSFINEVAKDAPFIFLGRLDRIKGCHHCIQLAIKLKHPLVIAGNISQLPQEKDYFEKELQPLIDGKLIKYVGPVNDFQKNHLLGSAKALLMPIDWDEPFGIVMVEAMACGTPVIGFNRGAVPEVIENTANGFIVANTDEMIDSVQHIDKIDRAKCRESVKALFSEKKAAMDYLKVYTS